MDTINIIVLANIIILFIPNLRGAKKGLKTSITAVEMRPKTFLQTVPATVVTFSLIAQISSVFQLGTHAYTPELLNYRITGLVLYLAFSWFQIYADRSLGDYFAQDIVILKNHKLISKGPYSVIRHPYYLGQLLADFGCAVALLSYSAGVLFIVAVPLLIMRALEEERLFAKKFGEQFTAYKKKTGFLLPFLG